MNPALIMQLYVHAVMLQARAAHDFLASMNPFLYSGEDREEIATINAIEPSDKSETTLKKDWTNIMSNQAIKTANQNNVRYVTPMVNYGNAGTTEIIRVATNK